MESKSQEVKADLVAKVVPMIDVVGVCKWLMSYTFTCVSSKTRKLGVHEPILGSGAEKALTRNPV